MARAATRRAIEWPRMLAGVGLVALGALYHAVGGEGRLGAALLCFGAVLMFIASLGRGCDLCGKVLQYREFGFSPARADEVTRVVASMDVDRVIDLLASPRIGDIDKPRTALMISCCPRCQQLAELIVGELGPGFRTRTEQIFHGSEVARLHQAVRKTRRKR